MAYAVREMLMLIVTQYWLTHNFIISYWLTGTVILQDHLTKKNKSTSENKEKENWVTWLTNEILQHKNMYTEI